MSAVGGESASDLEAVWTEVERAFVAASLGEVAPRDATERIRDVLAKRFGHCSLVEGHRSSGDEGVVEIRVGNKADETASTVVLPRSGALDERVIQRLQRLFERVLELAHPVPRGSKVLHELRNRLAGVQANLEFVEMVLSDEAESSEPEERKEIVKALGFAVRACREMATMLRGLGI